MSSPLQATNLNPAGDWYYYLNPDMYFIGTKVREIYGLTQVTAEENAIKLEEQNQRISRINAIADEMIFCRDLYPHEELIGSSIWLAFARPCCQKTVPIPTKYFYYDGKNNKIQKWSWTLKEDGPCDVFFCDLYKFFGCFTFVFTPTPWVCSGVLTGCSSDYSEKIDEIRSLESQVLNFKINLERIKFDYSTAYPGLYKISTKRSIPFRGFEISDAVKSQNISFEMPRGVGPQMEKTEKYIQDSDGNQHLVMAAWPENFDNLVYTQNFIQGMRAKGQHTIPQLGDNSDSASQANQGANYSSVKPEPMGEKIMKDVGKAALTEGGKFLGRMVGLPM